MQYHQPVAAIAIAAGLLAFAAPAVAQRGAARGTVKAMPLRTVAASETGRGQPIRVGAPLKVSRTLSDGRPVNLSVLLNALPSPNLRIAGASFLPAEQMLIVHIENKGSVVSEEGSLMAKVLWGADVDKEKLLDNPVGGKTQDEILASVVRDAMAKLALTINIWAASVKPLPPGGHTIVAIDLPDVAEEIEFCGFAGKQAKTDCVDPATQSVLSVTLLPKSIWAVPGGPKK